MKKIFIRFVIVILFFTFPIILFEVGLNRYEAKDINKQGIWYVEDTIIEKMNKDKLQNKIWYSPGLWIHEGQEVQKKQEGIKRILIVGDSYIWRAWIFKCKSYMVAAI